MYYRYSGVSCHKIVVRWRSKHNWSVRYKVSIYNRRCSKPHYTTTTIFLPLTNTCRIRTPIVQTTITASMMIILMYTVLAIARIQPAYVIVHQRIRLRLWPANVSCDRLHPPSPFIITQLRSTHLKVLL